VMDTASDLKATLKVVTNLSFLNTPYLFVANTPVANTSNWRVKIIRQFKFKV